MSDDENYSITVETADCKCGMCGNFNRCGYFPSIEAWVCSPCVQKVTGKYPRNAYTQEEVK